MSAPKDAPARAAKTAKGSAEAAEPAASAPSKRAGTGSTKDVGRARPATVERMEPRLDGMGVLLNEQGAGFRVWAPNASAVGVMGDFNDWSENADALGSEGNGFWYGFVVSVHSGNEYKFVITNGTDTLYRIDPYAYQVTSSVGNAVVEDPARIEVPELSEADARRLAARWAGIPEQLLPSSAAETLRLVGNLALGVTTVAALARGDAQRWAELADRLRRAELDPLELQDPEYRHPSLLAALQLGSTTTRGQS